MSDQHEKTIETKTNKSKGEISTITRIYRKYPRSSKLFTGIYLGGMLGFAGKKYYDLGTSHLQHYRKKKAQGNAMDSLDGYPLASFVKIDSELDAIKYGMSTELVFIESIIWPYHLVSDLIANIVLSVNKKENSDD